MQYTPKFFLESDLYGRVEITEPMKADGLTFATEQDNSRWGRDVTFGAEEISLYFANCYGMAVSTPQTFPDGSQLNHLSMGLPYILAAKAISGFETEMRFIISYEGVDFPFGLLDYSTGKSDGLDYWEGKIIQDTKRAEVKRNAETNVDVYSDKNLAGEAITPIETVDVLLPALPLYQRSTWRYGYSSPKTFHLESESSFNFASAAITYGVERSLGYIPGAGEPRDFPYIQAQNELTNVVVNISGLDLVYIPGGIGNDGDVRLMVTVYQEGDPDTFAAYELAHVFQPDNFGTDYSVTIPLVLRGQRIGIYFRVEGGGVTMTMSSMDVEIVATATAVSSIAKAAYLVKLYEQVLKSINGMPLIAPRFYFGKYAPIVAFNGFGLRGFDNKEWNNNWKDLTEGLATFNADTQITEDSVFMGVMEDFYPDRELDVFTQVPDVDFEISTNERATVNLIDLKCSGYLNDTVQDTDESGTLESVHTELQGKTPNRLVENKLKIETKFILDGRAIEQQRKLASTTKPTTSTNNDNKNYIVDTIEIPTGTLGGFTAYLLIRVNDDGDLQILNSSGTGDDSLRYFNWGTLGFGEDSAITIYDTDGLSYPVDVLDIESNVLTVTNNFTYTSGKHIIRFEYTYDNVFIMARRGEGFVVTSSDPLADPDPNSYYNLQYTPNRLLRDEYGAWLANICRWHLNESINITKFINNGELTTQLNEGYVITENAPIPVAVLPVPLVTDEIVKTRVAVGFERAKMLYEKMEEIHNDGTIGGYVTVQNSVGGSVRLYSQKASYLWLSGVMDVTGEVKESDGQIVTVLIINDGESIIVDGNASDVWNTTVDGNLIRINNISEPLRDFTLYSRYVINGVRYLSVEETVAAIGSSD